MANAKKNFFKKRSSKAKKVVAVQNRESNPPMLEDLAKYIMPGFVSFAATRLLGRITYNVLSKRNPRIAKHAAALSGIGSFGAAWLLAHKVEKLQEHETPIVLGSAIAAGQSIAQFYLPKYGWIVSDFHEQKQEAPKAVQQGSNENVRSLTAAEVDYGMSEGIGMGAGIGAGAGAVSDAELDELEDEFNLDSDF